MKSIVKDEIGYIVCSLYVFMHLLFIILIYHCFALKYAALEASKQLSAYSISITALVLMSHCPFVSYNFYQHNLKFAFLPGQAWRPPVMNSTRRGFYRRSTGGIYKAVISTRVCRSKDLWAGVTCTTFGSWTQQHAMGVTSRALTRIVMWSLVKWYSGRCF